MQGGGGAAHHHAVDQVQQQRLVAGANQPLGGDGGDAGGYNFVPNMYLSVPINPQWTFGLGVNVPFGLTTEYDDGWIGRYQALKSQIETINVNPALSWKVTPQFAVGVGVNYQYLKATLTQNVNYSAALLQAAAGPPAFAPGSADVQRHRGGDARARFEGDDHGRRLGVGLEHRPRVGCDAPASPRRELSLGDQVQRVGQRRLQQPDGALPPGTPPQLAGTIAAALRRRQQPGAVRPGRHLGHHVAGDRQPLDALPDQQPVGGDGRRAIHGLVEHPAAARSTRARRPRCRRCR